MAGRLCCKKVLLSYMMHPVPTDEAMLPMIDGLIDGLISGPFVDGISKQCNNVSLHVSQPGS